MINLDGVYSMHSQVIAEVKEKTPTPVYKHQFGGDVKRANIFYSILKGKSDEKANASKISNMGKKQKIKGVP